MAATRATKRKLTDLTAGEEEQPIVEGGAADTVTRSELQALESRVRTIEKVLLDREEHARGVLQIMEQRDQASRRSSRRSRSAPSVGSSGSSTDQSADGAEALTKEDQRAHSFDEIIDNLPDLDHLFDLFLVRTGCRSFVQRSNIHIYAACVAFLGAARHDLGTILGETKAQEIIAHLSNLNDEQITDVYIGLSHRHRARGVLGNTAV